jgi:Protein of unknown function (DUF1761)
MNSLGFSLLAVLISTVSAFILGGLWYSVFFAKAWANASGLDAKKGYAPGLVYGMAFVFNVVAAGAFGWLLGSSPALGFALSRGFVVGIGLVALSFCINYLGAGRKAALLFIDGGFHIIRFALFGLVFGLVH